MPPAVPPSFPEDDRSAGALRTAMDLAALDATERGQILVWLGEQLAEERFAQLDRAGHDPNDRIPLARVLVDVPIARTPMAEGERKVGATKAVLEALCSEDASLFEAVPPGNLGARGGAFDEDDPREPSCAEGRDPGASRGVVLIGGPGQGKSTITQSLCALHRSALLSPHAARLSGPALEAVESLQAAQGRSAGHPDGAAPLPSPAKVRLPLRISLPEAAAWLLERKDGANAELPVLLAFVAERSAKTPVRANALAAVLGHVDWLVVLDGLDEVPASEARTAVLSQARLLLDWLHARRPDGLVTATTRPQGYAGELDRWTEVQTWYLIPLGEDEAKAYARQLVRARYETKRGERILARLSEAAAAPAAARLLRTPLQVTILVALIGRIGRAPGERWSLFSEYYRIIYEREMERDLPAAELLRRYRSFIDRIHAHVGLLLQAEGEHASGADATMTIARLRDVMHAVFADQGMDAARRQPIIEELLSAITERLVLLVERRPGHVGFELRPLQELMAAWALAQKEVLAEERLLRVARSDAYREVVLFLASKAFAELSDVRDVLVDRVLPAMNEDPEEPLAAMVLRGSMLAVDVLEDGAALSQPKYLERLARLAVRLIDLPPHRVLPRLARICVGDPDGNGVAGAVLLQAIREKLDLQLSREEQLSAWCLLVVLADLGDEEAKVLADLHLLEIAPGLEKLVRALRTANHIKSPWLVSAATQTLSKQTPETLAAAFAESKTDLANALRAIHGGLNRISVPVRYTTLREASRLRWSSVDQPLEGLDRIADLEPVEASLRPLIAGAQFLLDPTAQSLGAALEYLAAHGWSDPGQHSPQMLPWPLGACVGVADDPMALRQLADAARAGNLGDTRTWRAAEDRCRRSGDARLRDLTAASALNWPLDGALTGAVLPLAAARVVNQQSGLATADDDQVLSLIGRLHETNIPISGARCLARVVWNDLDKRASSRLAFPLQAEDARRLWALAGTLPLKALQVAQPWTPHAERWARLLDEVGLSDKYYFGGWQLESLARFLSSHLEVNPERVGLLRLLEKLAANGMSLNLDWPGQRDYEGSRDRSAVVLVRLAQGRLSQDEALAAVPGLAATAASDSTAADRLETFTFLHVHEPALQRALVRGMLQSHSHEDWERRVKLVHAARAVLGEAPTNLDNPVVWDALQFPMPRPERRSASDRAPSGPIERRPVVIDEISVRNLRGIEELHLSPQPPQNGDGQWIILVGRNGVGKTTILRGLALSLFDIDDPVRRPLPPTAYSSAWRRVGASPEEPAFFRVKLRGHELEHGAEIRPRPDLLSPEQLKPMERPPNEMVFAYGVRRRFLVADLKRAVVPELYALVPSLFEEGADLLPIEESLAPLESAWHTQPSSVEGRLHVELRAALERLLRVDKIELRGQDLWVQSKQLGDVPLKELSDGYLTIAAWVVDLVLRWWSQAKRWKIEPAGAILPFMTGLVLVDEIDLFLHPDWQRSVIRVLKELFPRMSFVATTHNPLAILGARAEEIWILRRDDTGTIHAEQREEEPFRLTGSDLYDFYFGIESTLPDDLGQMLYRYRQVGADPFRTPAEDQEARKLLADLRARDMDPGWEPVPLEEVPPLPEDLA